MSTGPLPPPVRPALAGASAKAAIQAVAVRLISSPDSLKNNAAPVRVKGTVIEQSKNGSLLVETERGVVELMLKDRQGLPRGTQIDIDIPAGRSPQNATIQASSPQPQQTPETQPPAPTLSDRAARYEASAPTFIPDVETLEAVSRYSGTTTDARDARASELQSRLPSGPLLPGQYVRMIPIPPSASSAIATPSVTDFAALLNSLVESASKNIGSADPALRAALLTTLARLDIPSSLQTTLSKLYPQLMGTLASLTEGLLQSSSPLGASPLQSPALAIKSFNPTIGVDAQIIGLPISSGATSPASAFGASLPLHFTPPAAAAATPSPPSLLLLAQQPASAAGATTPSAPINLALMSGATANQLPVISVLTPASGLVQNYNLQFQATNLPNSATPTATPFAAAAPNPLAAPPGVSAFPMENIATTGLTSLLTPKISASEHPAPLLISLQIPSSDSLSADSLGDGGSWAGLKNLLFELTSADALLADDSLGTGTLAAQHMANLIPTPHQPQSMGALALFFLAMMRSNNPASWLPADASALLSQSVRGPGLLKGLAHDLSSASKSESLSVSTDWRGLNLPLLWDGDIHNLRFHYKHLPDNSQSDQENERKKRRLRFLFDLQLSRMGGVQVDGFMQDARLDIVLRTKTQLSPPMRERMRQVYAGAMDRSRLTGELSFQYKPEHWVDLDKEILEIGVNA